MAEVDEVMEYIDKLLKGKTNDRVGFRKLDALAKANPTKVADLTKGLRDLAIAATNDRATAEGANALYEANDVLAKTINTLPSEHFKQTLQKLRKSKKGII